MEGLSEAVLAAVAKAVAAKASGQLAGTAVQGVKKRVLGDPEEKAFGKALQRAYDRTLARHRMVLANYDVNPSFLQYEASSELAKALVPSMRPSADKLAGLCVDSLGHQPDDD